MDNQVKHLFDIPDDSAFRSYMRLTRSEFDKLLALIEEDITPQPRVCGTRNLTMREKLVITLKHLAHGTSDVALHHEFMIGRRTITDLIPEVLQAIIGKAGPHYLVMPSGIPEWLEVAEKFDARWNFPHVLGVIGGKHIDMIKPLKSRSIHDDHNYNGRLSIVLSALVGPDYRFLYTDIGACGRNSNGGIWKNSSLRHCLENPLRNRMGIPKARVLKKATGDNNMRIPYYIVADDAFPITEHSLKPFKPSPNGSLRPTQELFNARLSRARQTVECAFGQLANRFRVMISRAYMLPHRAKLTTTACVILHNFVMTERGSCLDSLKLDVPDSDTNQMLRPVSTRNQCLQLRRSQIRYGRHGNVIDVSPGEKIRNYLEEYLFIDDPVSWQLDAL